MLEGQAKTPVDYYPGTLIQEPAISKAEIERVSSCPLPELDTGSKNLILRGTLTEAIDWKIFVTCTLKSWHLMDLSQDLDKDEERQLFQAYPPIQPTNSYHDAFEFIVMAVLTSLYQNTGPGLSPDEQLGFFERVFLVTKLRTLTQLEKTSVEENLRRHGLYATLKNYILNWYISNTYFQYFNYSKNPDGRYQVARLWGMIQDSSGQPATGASYRLIDANISGHVLSGKTGGRQTRLNRLRILLPKEETRYARLTGTSTPNFSYNMELQFYLPVEQFKKDAAGEVTSTTITPHPTVSVLVEAPGYVSITKKIPLKHRFTHPGFPEPGNVLLAPPPFSLDSIELDIQKVELERLSGGHISLTGFPARMKFTRNHADLRRLFGMQSPPKGDYREIRISLGGQSTQSLSDGKNNRPVSLGSYSRENTLTLEGSFHLRGGAVTELLLEGQTIEKKGLEPLLFWSDLNFLLMDKVAIQSVKSMDDTQETRLRAALGDELEEMLEEADMILQAKAVSSQTAMADNYHGRKQVYTFYTIQGNVPVKGKLTQEALAKYKKQHKRDFDYNNFTLQIIGGKIPNSNIRVITTHMPRLAIGKDTILFLKEYVDKLGVLQGDRGQVDLR